MSFQKRQAYFSKSLNAQRSKEQAKQKYVEAPISYSNQAPTNNLLIPDLPPAINWANTPSQSPSRGKVVSNKQKPSWRRRLQKAPSVLEKPREHKNGVAWVVDESSVQDIPQFKKTFKEHSPEPYHSRSTSESSISAESMPSRSRRSPSPPSPPAQRTAKLKPLAKDTKTSALRAQLGPSSRAASPQPISRSQSPSIPGLPGRRKDYSKGRVSQYSQYFSRKKMHEKEERKKKEEDLRKARSQYYGDESDDGKGSPARSRTNRSPSEDSDRSISRRRRSPSESPKRNGRYSSNESDKSTYKSKLAPGNAGKLSRRGSMASLRSTSRRGSGASIASRQSRRQPRKYESPSEPSDDESNDEKKKPSYGRTTKKTAIRATSEESEQSDQKSDSDDGRRKFSRAKPNKSKYGRADSNDSDKTDGKSDDELIKKRSNGKASTRRNYGASRRNSDVSDQESDSERDEKRSKSRMVERKENDYEKADSPRYGKGWGFESGPDSAKSNGRDAEKSRKNVMKGDRRKKDPDSAKSRLQSNDSEEDDDDENNSAGKSSRTVSSAERHKRRMSYVPPKYRRNSINKTPTPSSSDKKSDPKAKKDLDNKTMSALSRRSVRNFDDKKYKSSSHLTPVDW